MQTEAATLLALPVLNTAQGEESKMSNYADGRSLCPIKLDCLRKVTQSLTLSGGKELDTVKLLYHPTCSKANFKNTHKEWSLTSLRN